jgi:carbamoyl-phosphate synthase small subunit
MTHLPGLLVLSDGTVFNGLSAGVAGVAVGELVFNTAATGYQEILTDPSYAHQLVMLTTVHVGNTGCNLEDRESSRLWAAGLVVREMSEDYSNYRADMSLPAWLQKHNIVAISGVDTRALTHHLRESGALNACIATDGMTYEQALLRAQACPSLSGCDLARVVSRQTIEPWYEGQGSWAARSSPKRFHVIVYDFGVKHSILQILCDAGCHITLVPAQTTAAEVLSMHPDGVVLSNGPGDPAACDYAIRATQTLLASGVPIMGICLGFQILGLACGATALKMKFGHHGANHPVIEVGNSHRVMITSQNHGFALDEASLPDSLQVTHRSLFDKSLQGIKHRTKPALGFQGHPEASPGPHDASVFFEQFIELLVKQSQNNNRKECVE